MSKDIDQERMKQPLVSVIIPVFNAGSTLRRAINSVLHQSYSALELIVIDDGSTDDSLEICRSYGNRLRCLQQENRGASAARNHGIRCAKGDFIGFLDADDAYLPEKISSMVELFNAYPNAGAVTGAFVESHPGWERVNPKPGMVFGDDRAHGLIDYFMCEYRGFWVVHTNTILIRREVLDAVGLFNVSFRFGEDIDLWCRVAGRFPMVYLDRPVAYYNRSVESSLCATTTVLGQGVDYLYGREEEKRNISKELLPSYRLFRNKILLARLMLSIYEKDRRMLLRCLCKLNPVPLNIRVLLALAVFPLPVVLWPKNRMKS